MSAGDPEAAAAAWRRVVAWCAARAPQTAAGLHGPADETALAAVQDELGQVWPDDLVALLRVSDGADRSSATGLIPWGFIPSPIVRIRDDWRMLTGIARDVAGEYGHADDLAAMNGAPAGAPAFLFLPSFVPIADDTGGDLLFIDLRPGELHGSVGRWWRDDGYHGPDYSNESWTSVTDVARTLADALEAGRWAPDHSGEADKVPIVIDGVLRWEGADDEETLMRVPGDVPAAPVDPAALRAEFLLHGGKRRSDTEMAELLGVSLSTIAELRHQIDAERPW